MSHFACGLAARECIVSHALIRSAAEPASRKPTTGIAGCCARAASGHDSAAPPSSVMNARRCIFGLMVEESTTIGVCRRSRDRWRVIAPTPRKRFPGASLGRGRGSGWRRKLRSMG
jgi:hypothetical protein